MSLGIIPEDKTIRILAFPPQQEVKKSHSKRKVVLITSMILGILSGGYYLETKKEGKKNPEVDKLMQSIGSTPGMKYINLSK